MLQKTNGIPSYQGKAGCQCLRGNTQDGTINDWVAQAPCINTVKLDTHLGGFIKESNGKRHKCVTKVATPYTSRRAPYS